MSNIHQNMILKNKADQIKIKAENKLLFKFIDSSMLRYCIILCIGNILHIHSYFRSIAIQNRFYYIVLLTNIHTYI